VHIQQQVAHTLQNKVQKAAIHISFVVKYNLTMHKILFLDSEPVKQFMLDITKQLGQKRQYL